MRRAVALALLLALPAYGQAREVPCETVPLEVATGTLRTVRDITIAVRGGTYLTEESSVCVAKRLAAAEAENRVWREAPTVAPPALIVATSLAFVLGATVGLIVWRAAR